MISAASLHGNSVERQNKRSFNTGYVSIQLCISLQRLFHSHEMEQPEGGLQMGEKTLQAEQNLVCPTSSQCGSQTHTGHRDDMIE